MTKREIELIAALLERVLHTPALNLDSLEDEDHQVLKACSQTSEYLKRYYTRTPQQEQELETLRSRGEL